MKKMEGISMEVLAKRFYDEYNANGVVTDFSDAVEEFDRRIETDLDFKEMAIRFARYRGDVISSDREAAAFVFALRGLEASKDPESDSEGDLGFPGIEICKAVESAIRESLCELESNPDAIKIPAFRSMLETLSMTGIDCCEWARMAEDGHPVMDSLLDSLQELQRVSNITYVPSGF